MNNQQIIRCLQECAAKLDVDLDISKLEHVDIISRFYNVEEFSEFKRDLLEAGNESGVVFIEKYISPYAFKKFLTSNKSPIIVFVRHEGIHPAFISEKKKKFTLEFITQTGSLELLEAPEFESINFMKNKDGDILTLSVFKYQSFSGKDQGSRLGNDPSEKALQLAFG